MKEINFYPNTIYYSSLEDILENIDKFNYSEISLDTFYIDIVNDKTTKINLTSKDKPIGIGQSRVNREGSILIDKEYYVENKDRIDNLLCKIIEKKKDFIRITGNELINDTLIKKVSENNTISNVALYGYKDEPYLLDEKVYSALKTNSSIKCIRTIGVENSLKENFDSIIYYNRRSLFGSYNYDELQTSKIIYVNNFSDDYNIENLKYLNKSCDLDIKNKNYEIVLDIMKFLNKTDYSGNITVSVSDKNSFNNIVLNNIDQFFNKKITIDLGEPKKYNINDYIKYEKRLLDMIKPAFNLSPLEKFMYAYNVVTKYKPYNENKENKDESRYVYEILDNDYMVCVGYSRLLVDLLTKLGIKAYQIGSKVGTGMENIPNEDIVAGEESYKSALHARVQLQLEDPKYNVSGVYISDPTWDNYMTMDAFAHSLMTIEEYHGMHRENYYSHFFATEILDSKNIEEYYKKVNFEMNYEYEKQKKDIKKTFNYNYEQSLKKLEKFSKEEVLTSILKNLKELYNLKENNYYINNYSREMFVKDIFYNIVNYKIRFIDSKEELDKLSKEVCEARYNSIKEDNSISSYSVVRDLLEFVQKYNIKLFNELIEKYPVLKKIVRYIYNSNLKNEELSEIISVIGDYILSVNNNKISGKTIMDAVKEVYKAKGLSEKEAIEKITEPKGTLEFNKDLYEISFPKRFKINQDGTKEVYKNEENKFDIAYGPILK